MVSLSYIRMLSSTIGMFSILYSASNSLILFLKIKAPTIPTLTSKNYNLTIYMLNHFKLLRFANTSTLTINHKYKTANQPIQIFRRHKRTKKKHTRRRDWGNGIAQCTTNICSSSRIEKNASTPVTHKLALHSCQIKYYT